MFTSVYSKQPEYMARTPDIPAPRHVQAPSILGDMRSNGAKGLAGRAFSADTSGRIDGSIPEYAANMPSTSRRFFMQIAQFFELASLCLGIASSAMFSIGGLTMSRSEAKKLSQPLHGPNPAITKSLVSQKYQFLLGALLLGIGFLLQLTKVLEWTPSEAIGAYVHQIQPLCFVPISIAILLFSILAASALTKRALRAEQ